MQLMVLILCSESTLVKYVKAHAHAPELIRRPAHTFVSSVSREPTQLCNSCFRLPLLTVVNVADAPPVNIARYVTLWFQLEIKKLVDTFTIKICTFTYFEGVIINN